MYDAFMLADGATELSDATSRIIRESIFGAASVILLMVAFWLLKKLIDTKDAQIGDQKETTSTLISVTTKFTEATKEFTAALNSLREATNELKETAESKNRGLEDLNTTNTRIVHMVGELRTDIDRWRERDIRARNPERVSRPDWPAAGTGPASQTE